MRSIRFLPEWSTMVRFLRDPAAGRGSKVLAVIALVYLLWPLDLVPDVAPLVGWLDDIGGLTFATISLITTIRRYQNKKPTPGPGDSAPLIRS